MNRVIELEDAIVNSYNLILIDFAVYTTSFGSFLRAYPFDVDRKDYIFQVLDIMQLAINESYETKREIDHFYKLLLDFEKNFGYIRIYEADFFDIKFNSLPFRLPKNYKVLS